jgi:hypothetical protein
MATVIKGVEDVQYVLNSLQFTKVNTPVLVEVATSNYRGHFLKLLAQAEDGDRRSRDTLKTAIECLSDISLQCLTQIGVTSINIPNLVSIAFSEKAPLFRQMINAAVSGRGQEHELAKTQLFNALGIAQPASAGNQQQPQSNSNQSYKSENRAQQGQQQRPNANQQQNRTQQHQQQRPNVNQQGPASGGGGDDNVHDMQEYRDNKRGEAEEQRVTSEDADYECLRFFGSKFAVCLNKAHKNGKEVINIDFATGSDRNFDWAKKIVFQCSPHELIFLYGVLMHYIPGWVSDMHATKQSNQKKTLTIEAQDGGYFISLMATGEQSGRGVKMLSKESATLKGFVYSRIKTWFDGHSDALIHEWIKGQCKTYTYAPRQKGQRNVSNG